MQGVSKLTEPILCVKINLKVVKLLEKFELVLKSTLFSLSNGLSFVFLLQVTTASAISN